MPVKNESSGSPSLRRRKNEEATNSSAEGSEDPPKYTDDQLKAVEQ